MNRLIFVTIALVFSLLLLTGINAQDGITVTDVNDDGVVDILDLTYVASHFGESSDPTQTPSPDVNGGGVVNILDLVIVANIIGDGKTETMPSDNTLIFGRGGDSITLDPSQVLDGEADIIERLYQGTGIPAKNPIPPTLWGYDDSIEDYPYDPELAKRLLAEAGYPDGFETTLWALPVPRPYIPNGQALAEILQSELRNIGIEATIVTYDWPTYLEKTENGEHDMAMLGWSAGGDPDNFLYYLLSKTTAEKPALNIAFY